MLQHDTLLLVSISWSNKNVLKTSNTFHSLDIIVDDIKKRIKINDRRQIDATMIDCPSQILFCCYIFSESKYDIGGQSCLHE